MAKVPEAVAHGPLLVSSNRYGSDVVVVSLAGELDQSNVQSARDAIFSAVRDGEEILVIDLSGLDFLDSSGIALLVAAGGLSEDGTALRIVPSESIAVSRVLQLTGVDSMIQVARERPAAAA